MVAAAYEVLFMLAAAPHPRHFELARGWGAALQRRLSPEALLTWRAFFGGDRAIGIEPARIGAWIFAIATGSTAFGGAALSFLYQFTPDTQDFWLGVTLSVVTPDSANAAIRSRT